MPRDTTIDVDRSVRQAARVGNRIQKRLLQAGTLALVAPKHDKQLSTVPSADQQEFRTMLEVDIPDDEHLDLAKQPTCSPGKFHGGQEPVGIASRTPSPVAPFCVDTSLQTFCSFLDLIKGLRERTSPVPALPARTPPSAEEVDLSTAPNGKRTCKNKVVTDAVGPESCGEPSTRDVAKVEQFNNQASNQQRADPAALANGFAVASRPVKMEVLRGTLKLLKVNLFHLVRIATMRRACRGHDVINPSNAQIGGHQGSGLKKRKAADKEGPAGKTVGKVDRVQFLGSRPSSDGVDNMGRDSKDTSPVFQGITFEALGQKGHRGGSVSAEDVHGVIVELHDELQTLLEEDIAQEDPETTNAALTVQVRSISH